MPAGCLPSNDGCPTQPLLQTHIVQPQRLRDTIHTVLPRQFHRRLPRLRQLRPPRPRAPELIQLTLQLHDRLWNVWCAFAVHDQFASDD
jgi:hypothetical protein